MKKQSRWKGSRKLAHLEHQRRKYEGRTQWSNSWVSKYYEHKKHMDARGTRRGRRI